MTELIDNNVKELEAQSSHDEILPPPPYSDVDGLHIFEVHYKDWRSHTYVQDDNGVAIFTGLRESMSSRLEVIDRNGNNVGKSRTSSLSTRIDVELFNTTAPAHTFEIRNHATFGSPRYPSPTFGGQQMTWKNKMMSKKILFDLMDESGKVYAKFESAPKTKIGRLEITGGCFGEDRLKEVVVTLLTLLIRKLRNINDVPQYGIIN
jgi:hypothetical protein